MEISKNVMLAKMDITEQDGKPVEHLITFCKADGSLQKMRVTNQPRKVFLTKRTCL